MSKDTFMCLSHKPLAGNVAPKHRFTVPDSQESRNADSAQLESIPLQLRNLTESTLHFYPMAGMSPTASKPTYTKRGLQKTKTKAAVGIRTLGHEFARAAG